VLSNTPYKKKYDVDRQYLLRILTFLWGLQQVYVVVFLCIKV
jgi:hypothetical protein